jgi:hypothetical protein
VDKPGSGIALCDIGMQGMLDELMKQFISPLSTGYILIYTSDLLSNFICR